MTPCRSEVRDELAAVITALIDAARNPENVEEVVRRLEMEDPVPPLDPWPKPSKEAMALARDQLVEAVAAVYIGAARLGIDFVYSTSPSIPEPRLVPAADTPWTFIAPLVSTCLEARAARELAVLLSFYYSPMARIENDATSVRTKLASKFGDHEVEQNLRRRINGYLAVEGNLWQLASDGGYPLHAPYAARYEIVRWLWTPATVGHAICLRCGVQLRFRRFPRDGYPRVLRCGPCSHGNPEAWPPRACCPAERGTWWLRCTYPGCNELFIGPEQARLCPRHRSSKLTRSKRKSIRASS